MTQLKALKPHRYGNRQIKPGEVYTASRNDARTLIGVGFARPEAHVAPAPAPVPPVFVPVLTAEIEVTSSDAPAANEEEAPKRRRRKVEETPEGESTETPAEPVVERPRRTYTRRDLTAEDSKE